MGGKRRFSESTVHGGTESEERIAADRIMMPLQSQFTQSVRVKEAAFVFPLNAVVPLINLLLSSWSCVSIRASVNLVEPAAALLGGGSSASLTDLSGLSHLCRCGF